MAPANGESRPEKSRRSPYTLVIGLLLLISILLGIYGIAAAGMPCKCPGCGPRRRPSRATLAARERDRQQQQGGAAADEAAADGEQQLERRHGPGEAEQSEDDGTSAENGDASGDGSKQAAEPPLGQDDAYVAMCTAVKDEHCDIREWILHHASLGVGKFYVFDTLSETPMEPVLDDLITSGLVSYQYVTNRSSELQLKEPPEGRSYNWQVPIFTLCLERYGTRHQWMGFIDADEFVVPTPLPSKPASKGGSSRGSSSGGEGDAGGNRQDSSSSSSSSGSGGGGEEEGDTGRDGAGSDRGTTADMMPALLRRFEAHGGVVFHWQLFGFDGNVERPGGGVLASYTSCWPQNSGNHRHVKSFVQPAHTIKPHDPHSFVYRNGHSAVNTLGHRVSGPIILKGKVSYQGAVLHHYISKSLADFEIKAQRRGGAGSVKTVAHFLKWHRKSNETCSRAVELGRALQQRYDLRRNVPERCIGPLARVAAAAAAEGEEEGEEER